GASRPVFRSLPTYRVRTAFCDAPAAPAERETAPGSRVVPASADTDRELIPPPTPVGPCDEDAVLPSAADLADQVFQFDLGAPVETAIAADALSTEGDETIAAFDVRALLTGLVVAAGITHRSLRKKSAPDEEADAPPTCERHG